MAYKIGRLGRLYAKASTSYGTPPTLAATNATRHLEATFNYDALNRVNSPERHRHPSTINRFNRRASGDFTVRGLMYASGILGTIPEASPFLKNAMGTETAGTASTTIASLPTVGGATLTSPTGMTVGKMVLIETTSGQHGRLLTSVIGSAVTWAPDLPEAPEVGADVKEGVTYSLASISVPTDLFLAKYLNDGYTEQAAGCVPDKLSFAFDSNEEPQFTVSGPLREVLEDDDAGLVVEPGGYTVVGGDPPSGITGAVSVAGAPYEILKCSVEMTNGFKVKNDQYGNGGKATAAYLSGKRAATLKLDAYVDDPSLKNSARVGSTQPVLIQTGTVPGSIWVLYAPRVDFKRPNTPDGDEELMWSFDGVARGTVGNDEFYVAQL